MAPAEAEQAKVEAYNQAITQVRRAVTDGPLDSEGNPTYERVYQLAQWGRGDIRDMAKSFLSDKRFLEEAQQKQAATIQEGLPEGVTFEIDEAGTGILRQPLPAVTREAPTPGPSLLKANIFQRALAGLKSPKRDVGAPVITEEQFAPRQYQVAGGGTL
ncbi:unnamed protein product, partial [marine sediment metagenome]